MNSMMTQKEKLVELIGNFTDDLPVRDIRSVDFDEKFADFLLENGVVAMPCRCKECEYGEPYENTAGSLYCNNKNYSFEYGNGYVFNPVVPQDHFCSYGKRKGGG